MALSESDRLELIEMLAALHDGRLEDSQADRLRECLEDPESQDCFASYAMLDACLGMAYADPEGISLPPELKPPPGVDSAIPPCGTPLRGSPGSSSPILGFLGSLTNLGGSFTRVFWTLLALVSTMALVALAMRGIYVHVDGPGPEIANRKSEIAVPVPVPIPNPSAPVARLTRLVNCRWMDAAAVIESGSGLAPGQRIDIVAGEAEITFACGAVVNVRGPSMLEIESDKSLQLLMGRLSARAATERSHGFAVHTRTASVIDLGTEFSVQAAADGHSEVYVVDGAVKLHTANHKFEHRLEAGQTAQIEPGEAGILTIIEGGSERPDFKFPTIAPPSQTDYADAMQRHATIRVVEGELKSDSAPVELLLDGRGQSKPDSPDESVFFADGQKGKILLDLGKAMSVHKINTYSWHTIAPREGLFDLSARATQHYRLYGSASDTLPATQGDPAAHGWTLINRVNTDGFFSVPPVKNRPGQQAVSIVSSNGSVGRYRFLLWEVEPEPAYDVRHGNVNTFFGEFDVYADD